MSDASTALNDLLAQIDALKVKAQALASQVATKAVDAKDVVVAKEQEVQAKVVADATAAVSKAKEAVAALVAKV